ncbi:MAG: helix-turn-helix domain-containing protein [Alphaproteobacteria bacterium]|nr:helix-turn-helix domain-containing protein [Alphaproteobacteria bacterium]
MLAVGNKAELCMTCAVRHLSICSALEGPALERFAAAVHIMSLDAQAPIFDEGEPATAVFNVKEGAVRLYKLLADGRRQIVGFLFEGDFLGLSGVRGGNYAYSAETVVPSHICRLQRSAIDGFLHEFPKMERQLLDIAAAELAAAEEQMLLLGRKTARERLASFLLKLSERAVRRGKPADPVSIPMSRTDIADFLGLTTETVSRTMTQLKRERLITLLPGAAIAISDRDALQAASEGD